MRHLRRLLDAVERSPDRPFLVDGQTGRTLTYGEMHLAAGSAAAQLRERGARRGDRIALSTPSSAATAALYLGALQSGFVVVPLGTGFGRRELRSILQRTGPRLVVVGGDDARVQPVASELDLAVVDDLDPFAPADLGAWQPFDGMSSDDLASIHFTSGTTGDPRGVGHRIADFVGNAARFADATGLDETHRFYATLPMSYMAGYYNVLLLPWTLGASVVLERAFDARSLLGFWASAREHEADTLWLVPTIMAMLLEVDRDESNRAWAASNVRFAACGTAPLAPDLRARFEDAYGITVHESYGLSETLLATSSTPAAPAPAATVGAALPGVDVAVLGPDGTPQGPGEEGEVHIASPDMMAGYLEGDGTRLSFAAPLVDDRWLPTGDTGRIGDDGALAITGRSKEIIIRGGVNVGPAEIERVLEEHAAVQRAAVVGIPHRILGEDVAAVVVLAGDADLEPVESELKERAREQLQPAQQPGVYVQIDELPQTPTGKIRKAALRDLVIDRLGLPAEAKGFTSDSADGTGPADRPQGRLVDLTHPVREGMTTFPGLNHPRVEITQLARHHVEGRATRRLVLGTHTGTHLDAPLHFVAGGPGVDQLDLDALVGPAQVADLSGVAASEEVGAERLREALGGRLRQPRLLLRFDWSERFSESLSFYADSPYLSEEACRWLVDGGVRALGMDTPSPDDPRLGFGSGNDSPNHHILLGAGVILIEYLANLDRLRSDEVYLMALPLHVVGADGAPARVVALDP